MRSLGTIRTRVERLAAVYPTAEEPPLIIHWKMPVEPCPSCGAEIDVQEEALARPRRRPTPIARGAMPGWSIGRS
jgi:hypothetical protein